MRRLLALALALSLLVGSVPLPVAATTPSVATPSSTTPASLASPATTEGRAVGSPSAAPQVAPADPATDVVGWEGGFWHNESIDVDQSDGLTDAELDAYVARSMARVEFIREREFTSEVPVSVIARDEFRNQTSQVDNETTEFGAWNNQVWEALFIDGEETDVQQELGSTVGESVLGFYSPTDDEIKIVTETPEQPVIDNATLIHELTHAMQDQYHNLSAPRFRGGTQDADLAIDGLVEGEANLVEHRYVQRCGGEWDCVSTPGGQSAGGGGPTPNLGILLTLLNPYSDGPVYVERLRQRGGWAAVDEAMASPPTTTEQIIHTTDEGAKPIDFEDRARNGWATFPTQGEEGSDTVGEASMYAMFWYQARTYEAKSIDPRSIGNTENDVDTYNYDVRPTAGWGNDRVFPYRRGAGETVEYGYVWVTEWDSEADAREFRDAYFRMLAAHDVRVREDGIRVVDDGPFADAFLLAHEGTTVTVVNGPTPEDVRDIRPGLDPAEPPGPLSGVTAPGFGVVAGLGALALLAVSLLARRRH